MNIRILRFFLRHHRRRLLKALDGPYDPGVSNELDAVDALLDGLVNPAKGR